MKDPESDSLKMFKYVHDRETGVIQSLTQRLIDIGTPACSVLGVEINIKIQFLPGDW